MLEMTHAIHIDALILQPAGRIDGVTAKSFEEIALALMTDAPTNVVVDMTNVNYLSSAGLRSLLIIAKQIKSAGGAAAICGLSENVAAVITVSGFDAIFRVHENASAARAMLNQSSAAAKE